MSLLEKAYAKINVNYISLKSGSAHVGMRQLTGMPSTYFSVKEMSPSALISLIDDYDKK